MFVKKLIRMANEFEHDIELPKDFRKRMKETFNINYTLNEYVALAAKDDSYLKNHSKYISHLLAETEKFDDLVKK